VKRAVVPAPLQQSDGRMRTTVLLLALKLGQRMSRNRGKIPRLGMPQALQINAQLTLALYRAKCPQERGDAT
jgi:hypothetical protein